MSNMKEGSSSGDKSCGLRDEGRELERQHRALFNSPSDEEWNSVGSLAQPSFLKQVDSGASHHTSSMNSSRTASEK